VKIIRFTVAGSLDTTFGVVIRNLAVPFSVLGDKLGKSFRHLANSRSYLANLPDSEQAAKVAVDWGEHHLSELSGGERFPLNDVRLLEPIEVAALFDFGLTPRHLKNSAETMMKFEKDNPQTAPLLKAFATAVMAPKPRSAPGQPEPLSYYKCNMNTIAGNGVTIPWPAYTSRLDVEPELAVVYGNEKQPVAGFCIFNDISARDVQPTEFVGGFCLTKDMANGNQLGPYLVTSDEVGDPYDLNVTVLENGHVRYEGSTSEISHKAEDLFAWLGFIAPLKAGSVMGFGTIPDCTGCDHDDFIDPGTEVQITFERLGTLRCRFGEPSGRLLPSRWPLREPLQKYHW
jgi:2-keto-4-pentenoate hydratase/2-oxohepta-3-ene-1,7-dioic acid hydratase in catechol pathway